jgi:hypothetical protein
LEARIFRVPAGKSAHFVLLQCVHIADIWLRYTSDTVHMDEQLFPTIDEIDIDEVPVPSTSRSSVGSSSVVGGSSFMNHI